MSSRHQRPVFFLVRVITHGDPSAIFYPPCCSEKYSTRSSVTLIQLCSNIHCPSSPPSNVDNNQATHIEVSCGSSVKATSHWNTSYHLKRGPRNSKALWEMDIRLCSSHYMLVGVFASRHVDLYKSKTHYNHQLLTRIEKKWTFVLSLKYNLRWISEWLSRKRCKNLFIKYNYLNN